MEVLCTYRVHEAGWWMLGSVVLSLWAPFGQLPTIFLAQLTTKIWQCFALICTSLQDLLP